MLLAIISVMAAQAQNNNNVIDEVIWVIGDDPILLSDVEEVRVQAEHYNSPIKYCQIPEQIAVQKLYLHQADLDSIEVSDADVVPRVNNMIDYYLQNLGSRENIEAYFHKSMAQLREDLKRSERDSYRIQQEQQKITESIKVTPAEVRAYFKNMPEDSLPMINTQVEVQIITAQPIPSRDEVERVEEKLRDFSQRITSGQSEFATLARFYSEDAGSASTGGELPYMGRGELVPEFANVAFTLNDPKKVSKIVKSEYGYHIIQLIDKRGDKIKVRHILLKPTIADSVFQKNLIRLDSISNDIKAGKFTFEAAARELSSDKDTRNNNGLLSHQRQEDGGMPTSRFEMKELNQDIAKVVDTLKVGQISAPFIMTNEKGFKVCAVVKLKNRIDAHHASMTEDFQTLRSVVYEKRCNDKLEKWVQEKINKTSIRIKPEWRDCDFKYKGWVK